MNLLFKLKEFSTELYAKVNKDAAYRYAEIAMKNALAIDNSEELKKTIVKCKNWIGESELSRFMVIENQSEARAIRGIWYPSWKAELVLLGLDRSIEGMLCANIIKPSDIVSHLEKPVATFEGETFRSYLWSKGAEFVSPKCWSGHAKMNPGEWKFGDEVYVFSDKNSDGLSWLKTCFVESIDVDRKRAKFYAEKYFLEPFTEDISLGEEASRVQTMAHRFSEYMGDSDPLIGLHVSVYKEFVEIGWCTAKDVKDFQEWVQPYDGILSTDGLKWCREDVMAWAEKELLVGQLDLPVVKNQKRTAL